MEKNTVVVTVSGGVAYLSVIPENIRVMVIDYDNDEADPGRYLEKGPVNNPSEETLKVLREEGIEI